MKDKERYKMEMEVYRERLRTGQITEPVQNTTPIPSITDLNCSVQFEGSAAAHIEAVSSDKSGFESGDKDLDFGECSQADMDLKNVNIEVMADEAFDLQTRPEGVGHDDKKPGGDEDAEDGISVRVEGIEHPVSNANESAAVNL